MCACVHVYVHACVCEPLCTQATCSLAPKPLQMSVSSSSQLRDELEGTKEGLRRLKQEKRIIADRLQSAEQNNEALLQQVNIYKTLII